MNTPEEQKKLSESLLKACKAAGIEKPKYIAQDQSGLIYHYNKMPFKYSRNTWGAKYDVATKICHPPYATDWKESLLEWVEPQGCKFKIGQTVMHKNVERVIYDIDEGYDILALDGDKYISPNDPSNRCIEAKFSECEIVERQGGMATYKSPEEWASAHKGEPLADVLARHPDHVADGSKMIPSGIEAMVCADIANRQQVGIAKYGVTVAENPLTHAEWLQHAYEECLDMAVYLKRAMAEKGGDKL